MNKLTHIASMHNIMHTCNNVIKTSLVQMNFHYALSLALHEICKECNHISVVAWASSLSCTVTYCVVVHNESF